MSSQSLLLDFLPNDSFSESVEEDAAATIAESDNVAALRADFVRMDVTGK